MLLKSFTFIIIFSIILLPLFCIEDNFYDILQVPTDADTKTIRKAFKKIAILKHPDKNPVGFIFSS